MINPKGFRFQAGFYFCPVDINSLDPGCFRIFTVSTGRNGTSSGMEKKKMPKRCIDCDELETCPFPSLMEYLKRQVHEKFHGNIVIPFRDGFPGKLRREEIVDLENF